EDKGAEAFPLLDAYLEDLHAGRLPDRAKLLAEHPELASALNCLDALEHLAPPAGSHDPTLFAPRDSGLDSETPRPSLEFGKYELLAEIGRGGMGVVFKARQKDLDRVVAVKMILAGQLASPEHVHRFNDEARAAARLQHQHIVAVYEAGEVHGQPYLA